MKKPNSKKNKNLLLKIISLILGFSCWYLFMYQQYIDQQIMIPVSFHNLPKDKSIIAPELVEITIRGKRADIYGIDSTTSSFHINAKSLKIGNNKIPILPDQFSLPEHISLLSCRPSTILVYMYKKENKDDTSHKDYL